MVKILHRNARRQRRRGNSRGSNGIEAGGVLIKKERVFQRKRNAAEDAVGGQKQGCAPGRWEVTPSPPRPSKNFSRDGTSARL